MIIDFFFFVSPVIMNNTTIEITQERIYNIIIDNKLIWNTNTKLNTVFGIFLLFFFIKTF